MKKVICRCNKVIKLDHYYDETFLNIHINDKGCLVKQGKSDDDENMGNDDLFKIDKISNVENDCESEVLKALLWS
ncbi:3475_t:CDS:2 [Racocetra fulgida]|uniref:3475_t:CDS:1 n=1 Tax=Racocetra fulgida TaxID=60492 RepID=A0A9N8W460_9GLOM|nr:3475_t:CDS:2 [Racocetra fulgida]